MKKAASNKGPSEEKQQKEGPSKAPVLTIKAKWPWWFRVLAFFGIPLFALGFLETGLRLIGIGYSTDFFRIIQNQGQNWVVDNPQFSWQFFPRSMARSSEPVLFASEKAPQTRRVFILGESAAMGDPDPAFGFGRMLEVMLQHRYPDIRFEIINVSITAINSHVVKKIAADCARYSGDIWIVYMGNNEVVGPFGAGTVFSLQAPGRLMIEASLRLKRLRIGQLIDAVAQNLAFLRGGQREWGGMAMFAQQKVAYDDPRLRRVHRCFESNLKDILHTGQQAGVRILLCTLASNLKDCAPFASLRARGLDPSILKQWDELCESGIQAQKKGAWISATNAFNQALRLDSQYADLHYRLAQCLWALEDYTLAKDHFTKARDLDALRFRPDSTINDLIRQTARNADTNRIRLVDAAIALQEHCDRKILGHEVLYEHVHLNFEGNYFMAKLLAESISQIETNNPRTESSWLTASECGEELAWTAWNHHHALETIHERMLEPPYTFQLDHDESLERWQGQMTALRPQTKPYSLGLAAGRYRTALAKRTNDWTLLRTFAQLQEAIGDYAAAVDSWDRLTQMLPNYARGFLYLGDALRKTGRNQEALECYHRVLEMRAESKDVFAGQGMALLQLNRVADAAKSFRKALRLNSAMPDVHLNLGIALLKQNKLSEARQHFIETLAYEPSNVEAKERLQRIGETPH